MTDIQIEVTPTLTVGQANDGSFILIKIALRVRNRECSMSFLD